MLEGKIVVVGVTGGIAAYKAAELVSRLRKARAEVHVVMTSNACNFVNPITFQSLSANPVHINMYGTAKLGGIDHIELAQKADLIVVAPATANSIAKAAGGLADDLLSTVLLAKKAPVLLAPAMNAHMYLNPITQSNLSLLVEHGFQVMTPGVGFQACGSEGPGRMPEPAEIYAECCRILCKTSALEGKTVLITAGGTQEPIDPVRYIGNRSSGKMGYALAKAARDNGAKVILISGPTSIKPPAGVKVVQIATAAEMFTAVMQHFPSSDIIIKAAAVADYRPVQAAEHKIKKSGEELPIHLVPNPDILQELGKQKGDKLLVGFAAETRDLIDNAVDKLQRKNLDMLVANDVTKPGAGFGSDTNLVAILYRNGDKENLPLMDKEHVALEIINRIISLMNNKAKE
jgi:phosphopantothenoylcysteine decarboxylase / phosphopantothenate---cysteine ligase